MGISINTAVNAYQTAGAQSVKKPEGRKAPEDSAKKNAPESAATVEISSAGKEALSDGKVTEKTSTSEKVATMTSNAKKMSEEDRAALIDQLKADQESYQSKLISLVQDLFTKQAGGNTASADMWKFLASGNFTVDAQTKAQAQEAISEDGYYGVSQTSERMFQFALALSGGDVDKMKELQNAVEKGYKQAEKTWGGELPEISKQTLEATNALFEEFYQQNETATTTEAEA
ncbi:MAG: hypothetical protein K6G23_07385 [Lachnospiraceae bacterium]|nr:hypothetical protein [Lachnospiraceae bacterium]